ncbi:MAG: GNAT family N-acetyltransferase, partial [Bacteroidota bacterium]
MTTENISIRVAEVKDIPAIIYVAEATWTYTYRDFISQEQIEFMYAEIYHPDALQKQMTELAHTFLLLYLDEIPIAFASFAPRGADQTVFKLHKIYLLPDQQGKGLGKVLIEEVCKRVREAGGLFLDLNVNRHNPARHFYERCHFQIIREEDIPIGSFVMNDYVMRR